MRTKITLAASLLAATAMAAAPAHAQRVDRIVTFGDSYADDGNFFELAGIDPVTTGAYTTGRFSGGTNYIDTLSRILGVEDENFAIGGAQANGSNVNFGFPGLAFQIDSFFAGGGGPAFPVVNPLFDEGDLVTFNIGGNDSRAYQQNGGTIAGAPAAAQASINGAISALNRVVAAGAPTISFISGDASVLPEVAFAPNPAQAAAVRSAFSNTYNTAVRAQLADYAAAGVMVHYLDLGLVANNIENNLEAFGFDGIACPPFSVSTACIADQNLANSFVFYGDLVHLTSAGYDVVGAYVAQQLRAPLTLGASSEIAMDSAHGFAEVLYSRLDGSAPRDGDMAEGLRVYVAGDYYGRNGEMTMAADPYDMESHGITAGIEIGTGNSMIGLAGRYSMPEAEYRGGLMPNAGVEAEATSLQLGAYAAVAVGPLFAQAYGGYGWDDHEIEREGMIDTLERSADADGDHWLAGGKIGYLANVGIFRLGPVAELDYASVDVDGYVESGDPALNLIVDDIDYSELRGLLGIELRGDFGGAGANVRPFAMVGYEKPLDTDDRTVTFSQTSSPEIVNSWTYGADESGYLRGRVGLGADVVGALRVNAQISGTAGRDLGDETSATVSLGLRF